MKYTLGFRIFNRKQDAVAEVRRILNTAEIDRRIMGDAHVLIAALFAQHPRAHEKAHLGVCGFMVRINDLYGAITRGLHVIHDDARTTAFSYVPCFKGKSDEPTKTVAMRLSIIPSQRNLMRAAYRGKATLPCAHCGAPLTQQQAQVHHKPPKFRELVDRFCERYGGERYGEPNIINAQGLGDAFADPAQRALWIQFHDARAVRVILCAACNHADERRDRT